MSCRCRTDSRKRKTIYPYYRTLITSLRACVSYEEKICLIIKYSAVSCSMRAPSVLTFCPKECSIAHFLVGLNATAIFEYSLIAHLDKYTCTVSHITKMNGTKSKGRGRSPKVPKFNDEKAPINGSINGKPNEYSNINQQPGKRVELSENIFLFYPNLIGMLVK